MSSENQAAMNPNSEAKVDVQDRESLQRWASALGVTAEALESAVQAVGPRVDLIKDYLTAGMAGDQEDA